MDQNQAFFVSVSLSLTIFFLGSKLNLVWHSHVRYWWSNKGLCMGFRFALKFENWEDWAWMCIYMNKSTVLLSLLLLLLAAAMLCWLTEPICMCEVNALTLMDFPLLYFTSQVAWFLGFWVGSVQVTKVWVWVNRKDQIY